VISSAHFWDFKQHKMLYILTVVLGHSIGPSSRVV